MQVLLHSPRRLQRRLLGRVVRGILPWCSIQNNSLRTFALLNTGMLLDRLGAPGVGSEPESGGGGSGAASMWWDEFGVGGMAILQQVRSECRFCMHAVVACMHTASSQSS